MHVSTPLRQTFLSLSLLFYERGMVMGSPSQDGASKAGCLVPGKWPVFHYYCYYCYLEVGRAHRETHTPALVFSSGVAFTQLTAGNIRKLISFRQFLHVDPVPGGKWIGWIGREIDYFLPPSAARFQKPLVKLKCIN